MALGYSLVTINNQPGLFPPSLVSVDDLAFIDTLLTQLDAIDADIAANTKDSMAEQVQDLKLNYNRYMVQALMAGSRLLNQLSTAISTPIMYNRYAGGQATSVQNYY
jgi:hypothetical protein